jgi:hypothetical protein
MPKNSKAIGALFVLLITLSFYYASKSLSVFRPRQAEEHGLSEDLSGLYNDVEKVAEFHGSKVAVPEEKPLLASAQSIDPDVLGSKTDRKRIEIDLAEQKIYAYEGGKLVHSFYVSTGKWGATPTGEFRIWTKLRYTLMTGGSEKLGTYYYLPNVPFTMYFYNGEIPKSRGYGIHGAYWHDNFGHPMSHGCVNMRTEEVEQLFHWANPVIVDGQHTVYADGENMGTKVIIYGEAPNT